MLKLSLSPEEYLTINGNIVVQLNRINGGRAYLSVNAAREIPIVRGRVLEREGAPRPACLESSPAEGPPPAEIRHFDGMMSGTGPPRPWSRRFSSWRLRGSMIWPGNSAFSWITLFPPRGKRTFRSEKPAQHLNVGFCRFSRAG